MLKGAGILMVMAACTALGFCISLELDCRLGSLKEIQRMMEMLRGEIQYGSTPLQEAFLLMADQMSSPFSSYLRKIAGEMEKRDGRSLGVILEENGSMLKEGTGLLPSDIKRLVRAGGRLGYLDRAMQLKTLDMYLEELAGIYGLAREEYQGKGKMYRCLGFMGGLFFAVIFL